MRSEQLTALAMILICCFAFSSMAGEAAARTPEKTPKEPPPPGYRLTSIPIVLGSGKNPALQPNTHVDVYAILSIKPESDVENTKAETAVARLCENAIVVSTEPVQPQNQMPVPQESWVSLWIPMGEVDNVLLARELASAMGTQFCCVINPGAEGGEQSNARRLVTAGDFLNNLRSGMRPAKKSEADIAIVKKEPATLAPAPTVTAPAIAEVNSVLSEPISPAVAAVKIAPIQKLADKLPDGVIRIDGSSTVFPIIRLLKQEFARSYPNVKIDLKGEAKGEAPAGTSGGFKKFLAGESDICNASRYIKDAEIEKATKAGIEIIEIPIAWDGLTVVASKQSDWVNHLTIQELKDIWKPGSVIRNWKDIRPSFPVRPLLLSGPGSDSGTFDYFTEVIVGEARQSRADYMASEDDEIIAKNLMRDPGGLGYFGMAYFDEHKDRLKALAIDAGQGPIAPTAENIINGTYTPLSRPLFVYISAQAAKRPEVDGLIKFLLTRAGSLSKQAGYIPFPDDLYTAVTKRYLLGTKGTLLQKNRPQASLQSLLGVTK